MTMMDPRKIQAAINVSRTTGDEDAVKAGEGLLRILAIADQAEAEEQPRPYVIEPEPEPDGPRVAVNDVNITYDDWHGYDVFNYYGARGFNDFAGALEISGRKVVKLQPQGHVLMLATGYGDAEGQRAADFFGGAYQSHLFQQDDRWVVCLVPNRKPEPGELETVAAHVIAHAAESGLQLTHATDDEFEFSATRRRLTRENGPQVMDTGDLNMQTVGGLSYGSFLDLATGKPVVLGQMKPRNVLSDAPTFTEQLAAFHAQTSMNHDVVRNIDSARKQPEPEPPPPPVAPARRQRAA